MNARVLLAISRPRFWLYTAGPVLVGFAFAAPSSISLAMIYALVWFSLPANLFLYGVNDLADRDTDRFNPKKGVREHRLRSRDERALVLAVLASLALFVPLALIVSWPVFWFFVGFIVLGAAYSLPPRFKARPILDAASNVLYVLPGFGAYALVSGALPSFGVMAAAALWSAAMHWLSAIPDIESDRKAGLSTSATLVGARVSLILVSLLWLSSIITARFSGLGLELVAFGLVYPLIPLALLFFPVSRVEQAYWYFPRLNALAGFLLFVSAFA